MRKLMLALAVFVFCTCGVVFPQTKTPSAPPPVVQAPLAPAPVVESVPISETREQYVARIYGAVTLLYKQTEEGGMNMACTATAYRKVEGGYRFVSAAHCVTGESDEEQKDTKYFVTPDAKTKVFTPAILVRAGDKKAGDDFAIFTVITDQKFEVMPLGDDTKLTIGSPLTSIAAPLGLGKQYFTGYVSVPKLDRPPVDAKEVKWHDVMLVVIGAGPGSSGSTLISDDQKAIIGFLVGSFNGATVGAICVPVSAFKEFERKVDAGTYKKRLNLKNFLENEDFGDRK